MTRLQRAICPFTARAVLALILRAAYKTMEDMVQVDIRVKMPVSRELLRRLQCERYSKGPWIRREYGWMELGYPVKTCYPEHLPGFAREILAAMRVARCEGKRLIIVRYP